MNQLHNLLLVVSILFPATSSFLAGSDQITHTCNCNQLSETGTATRTPVLGTTTDTVLGKASIELYSTSAGATAGYSDSEPSMKPRILCLHGKSQSGAILSNKIKGATRKLTRVYDLDFLDGPILEAPKAREGAEDQPQQYAWWIRNEQGRDILMHECFEYVLAQIKDQQYDAILGFSQGGLLATALVSSGKMPGVKAVVTAGAPFVQDAWDFAFSPSSETGDKNPETLMIANGMAVPKLHFAGETDTLIPVERVEELCDQGGNGILVIHEKGHMFPTKAVSVNKMMEFLQDNVGDVIEG